VMGKRCISRFGQTMRGASDRCGGSVKYEIQLDDRGTTHGGDTEQS
jgi:hypothetical protein